MSSHNKDSLEIKGNYIAGEFRAPSDVRGEWKTKSPADFDDALGSIRFSYADVDRSVDSARQAFPKWSALSLDERKHALKKVKEEIAKREEAFLNLFAREVGKPLWEAKTEFQAVLNKFEISWTEGLERVQDRRVAEILPGTEGRTRFRPLGVLAVIGPFNFPVHLPNGHVIPALLMGNTVVFKPSEKAPLLGQLYVECFAAAGLPPGAINLIQGDRETSRRLVTHEAVDGVLFTGSYEVGVRIKQDTLHQHWKLLALEMGGKNNSIVFADSDYEYALHETLVSAFITAGQRCTASSRILVERPIFERFVESFHAKAKSFGIAHPFDDPFMGPLIDEASVDRYIKYQGMAQREGCELVMRGKLLEGRLKGNYVTPSICVHSKPTLDATKKSSYQQTELFAPNALILPFDSAEEAVQQANATQYGLVTSVFAKQESVFEACESRLRFGVINWNRSTIGASSKLPFGGLKKSGNHQPSASFASRYCSYPVAELRVRDPEFKGPICKALNW